MFLDLNCDLGEGCPCDAELLTLISSANVACGAHAGEPAGILQTLRWALANGVVVGAHPGHPDRENFGRLPRAAPPEQVFAECVYQVGALLGLAQIAGVAVRYLKPHGELFHQCATKAEYARVIVQCAEQFALAVVGLPNTPLEVAAAGCCPFFAEGYADRRYHPDGLLVPRHEPGAFVHDPEEAVRQVTQLAQRGIRTICVHGDNPQAVIFVRRLREHLLATGFEIRAFR
jgi:UPF0271 protein